MESPIAHRKSPENPLPFLGPLTMAILIVIIFAVFAAWMLYEADGLKHPLMKTDQSTERDANMNP